MQPSAGAIEARGIRFPLKKVTGGCELPSVSAKDKTWIPQRAVHILNC